MDEQSKYVNLALGGGGAKGIVHVGVLQALDQLDFTIGSIGGTSIGAIWAALFSKMMHIHADKPNGQRQAIDDLTREALAFQISHYLDFDILRWATRGVFKGDKLERWLSIHLLNADTRKAFT